MCSFIFAGRLAGVGFAFLIATNVLTVAQDQRRCFSITDVNERIDCLESGGVSPSDERPPSPNVRPPKQGSTAPSFDCRAASNSVERAICRDTALSEWDYRMGQQYQQALRARKGGDAQSVAENQRAWLLQRNNRCSAVNDTAFWACLLEMTTQRVDALTKLATMGTETGPMAQLPDPAQTVPKNQASPVVNTPSSNVGSTLASVTLKSDASSSAPDPILIGLLTIVALSTVVIVCGNISRRERLARERRCLVAKYGEEVADRIIARQVWQGMTDEQLTESWGAPADVGREITRTKVKETWKYGQTGKNRFRQRVSLEDGIVVGWKT